MRRYFILFLLFYELLFIYFLLVCVQGTHLFLVFLQAMAAI